MKMTKWCLAASCWLMPAIAQAAPVQNAASEAQPMQNDAGGTLPFSASSMASAFAIRGQLSGNCYLRNEELVVNLNRGQIFSRADGKYRGPRHQVSISANLATSDGGSKWKIICRGNQSPIGITVLPGESFPLNDLTFNIASQNQQIDLSQCWLVFQITGNTQGKTGFSYIHTDRKLFAAPTKAE